MSKTDNNGIFLTFTGVNTDTSRNNANLITKEASTSSAGIQVERSISDTPYKNYESIINSNKNSINKHIPNKPSISNIKSNNNVMIPFPLMPSYMKSNGEYNSLLFQMIHPERPIDKRKAINFNLNPGLCKGRVFLSSRGDEEIKESERLQQIYYMLSHDFNKIYIRDKNQYKWNSPHTPREKIKDEMQNRRSCKYVDNRDKYNKLIINNNNCIINNKKEIKRAKDIVLDKVPKMRNMGYQNMASEKVFGLHTEGENKKVNEVNIKI